MGGYGIGYYNDTYTNEVAGPPEVYDTYAAPGYLPITPGYQSGGIDTPIVGLPYSVENPDGTIVQRGSLSFAPTAIGPNGGGSFEQIQTWDPALGQYVTHMYDEFGNVYYVDEAGNVVDPGTSTAAGAPADTYGGGTGGDTYLAYDKSTGTYYKKSKSKSSSSGSGYSSNGSSGGDTYASAFPFADGFGNANGDPTPVYANGMVHPFFGGSMTSGEAGTGGSSRQMTVPETGATAGPYGVSGPSTSGGGYSGGSASGSGGGGSNSYYWNIRNNILGNMGGSSSGSYPSDAEYRAAQNAADRAYKKDQKQAEQQSQNQSQFYSLYSNPTYALPSAINNDSTGTPGYNMLSSMPVSQLALMTSGYQGKDTYTKRPESFKRTLADLYQDLDRGNTNFTYNSLMGNLFDASNQSTLGRMFMTQKPSETVYNKDGLYKRTNEGAWKNAPAATQSGTMMSMLNAVYGTTLSPKMASAYSASANQALDAYGENNWNRKNPQSVLDYMRNYLGY